MNHLLKLCLILTTVFLLLVSQSFAQDNKQPELVFATPLSYMPYSSVDAAGYVHGFSISFTQHLCKDLGMRCVYRPMSFYQMFQSVKNNKVDAAVGSIAITPGRQKNFAFTLPYLTSQANFIGYVAKGETPITKIDAKTLAGKKVGAQIASIFPQYILSNYPTVESKYYSGIPGIIAALVEKKIDFALIDTAAANFWVNQAYMGLYIVGKPINPRLGVGLMLNKNNPELLAKLNAAILKLTATETFKNMLATFFLPIGNKGVTQNDFNPQQ